MTPLEEILKEIDDTIASLHEYDSAGHVYWNQFREMVVKKIKQFNDIKLKNNEQK